jgi:hypothetical protein
MSVRGMLCDLGCLQHKSGPKTELQTGWIEMPVVRDAWFISAMCANEIIGQSSEAACNMMYHK